MAFALVTGPEDEVLVLNVVVQNPGRYGYDDDRVFAQQFSIGYQQAGGGRANDLGVRGLKFAAEPVGQEQHHPLPT